MRIGVSRPSYEGEETGEILAAAHRHGFEGVQLKHGQFAGHLSSPGAFKDAYGDRAVLARGGLITYPGGDPAAWEAKLEPVVAFAEGVAAGHVCICAAVDRSDTSPGRFKAVAEALMEIGRRSRERGVMVSLHNHVDSLFETEEDLARLVEDLDPELCGLTLDTGHTAKAGIADPGRLVERFKEHLVNVHLKDLSRDGRFCPLGRGTVDLASALDAIASVGYDGWLIVDEESCDVPTDEAFRISREFLEGKGVLS